MEKILLLGGYGFIGSNILSYIDKNYSEKYEVVVFDKFQEHPYGLKFKCVKNVYSGDFGDSTILSSIFGQENIDFVIHSLSSTVPATSRNVRFDIESNIIPTIELLELMASHKVQRIIYLSSGGAIYGNINNKIKHSEDDLTFPLSSYGIVKLCVEKYLYQYNFLYGINPLILRLSNPYGPYHFSSKQGIVNVALRSAFLGNKFSVWGDGENRKDYIFIEDFCDIIFKLIEKNLDKSIINIGSSNIYSVNSILKMIKNYFDEFEWNYKESLITDVTNLELNTDLLRSKIGEYKFTPLSEGIEKTINWIKEHNENTSRNN